MYSTLAAMSQFKACVPGFTRQASFYGIKAKKLGTKIPLHVIALLGGSEDAGWAADHALWVDPEEYAALYRRTLVTIWRQHLYSIVFTTRGSRDSIRQYIETPEGKAHIQKLLALTTFDEINAEVEHMRWSKFGSGWLNNLKAEWMNNPVAYIKHVIGTYERRLEWEDRDVPVTWKIDQKHEYIVNYLLMNDMDPKTPCELASVSASTKKAAPRRYSFDEEEEEEESDADDEDDRPRAARPPMRGQRAVASAVDSSYVTSVAVGRKSKSKAPAKTAVTKYKVPRNFFMWKQRAKHITSNATIAHILNESPYAFMDQMEFRAPKSITVNKEEPGVIVLRIANNQEAFEIMRTLNKRPIPD